MTSIEIEATFALGHRLPPPVVDICAFLDVQGYPISGCFELSKIGVESLKGWFRKDPLAYQSFLPFGRGACGDVYALWLTEGLSPDAAPVVMFGSEGALVVIATDAKEFCRLLCLGYSEIGLDDPASCPAAFDETEPFRRFMQARYGFQLPATAESIMSAAAGRFPAFKDWVLERQD
ncbi:hypothetical protein GCM10023213_12770 [Prosthecobacter algae]|uniref:SUKH-4 immunity protein of toxin-antitoxin system n=1 Tax=Prosthecobacter algae TaxID=1144682 RepID=A0ABP9NYH1_9BACT